MSDSGNRGQISERLQAVRATWWPDIPPNVDGRFFFGRGADREPLPDEVFLDVPDNYECLPHKVLLST